MEWQYAVVQEVAGRDGHLRGVHLGEGDGTRHIDENLDIHFAHALERAPVESFLIQELSRVRSLDMAAAEVGAVPFQEAYLFGR